MDFWHTRYARKPENVTHNWEKNQSIEINPQTVEKMELANKDIKIAT